MALFDFVAVLGPNAVILFLTKFDLLKQKLVYSPLENYFPGYTSGDSAHMRPSIYLSNLRKLAEAVWTCTHSESLNLRVLE